MSATTNPADLTDLDASDASDTFTAALMDLIERHTEARVRTFTSDGILTYNDGFVITLPTGAQFQVTVVQSELPR